MDKRVGVLGGGQLGRMLIESANRLNIQVNVLDVGNAPAKQITAHDGHIDGSFKDAERIKELAKKCDVVTIEIEHVNTQILEEVSSTVRVEPSWQTIRTIQDKFAQKQQLAREDIALAEFKELKQNTKDEVQRIGDQLGFPLMLKSKTQAYDGRGNYPVKSPADIPSALSALSDRPLYAEKWASFKCELAVMVVKTASSVLAFPTVETVHEDSICKLVYAPPRSIPSHVDTAAQDLARRAVACFPGKGVFGVEMFLLPDNTLLVNEIAPRPHNSGHFSIEACPLSQYDAHLRAILDLPIPAESLVLRSPAVMLNILGGATASSHLQLAERALSIPGASIHLYAKGDARPGRKMGHITVTAASSSAAQAAIAPLVTLANDLRAQRTDIPAPSPSPSSPPTTTAKTTTTPPPIIGVIMGSASDLPHLHPALHLLTRLSLPFETRITSAHRTPAHMAAYARTAASRGLRVIIAAAGGAAHLPGMVAAYTSLPVIGVPIKVSSTGAGDGMDALLSIVMMPRGVPVATVGIGNAVNAALLAGRVVGAWDAGVRERVEGYAREAEGKALESDEALVREGWEGFKG